MRSENPVAVVTAALPRLEPLRSVCTDALDIPRAIFAGYDWGGRAACVAAALWPERCAGIVSVNSYLIQDVSLAMTPIRPDLEAGFWYFYYFLTSRGKALRAETRRGAAHGRGSNCPFRSQG